MDDPPPAPETDTGSSLPSLAQCRLVIAKSKSSGLKAIRELPALLKPECPELAEILRSAAIRTSLESFERQDAESIRQQTVLKQEAIWANLCLLAAGVISALILAVCRHAGTVAGRSPPRRGLPQAGRGRGQGRGWSNLG